MLQVQDPKREVQDRVMTSTSSGTGSATATGTGSGGDPSKPGQQQRTHEPIPMTAPDTALRGHVFIVHGDTTRLACDARLIPTDAHRIPWSHPHQWRLDAKMRPNQTVV